VNLGPTRIRWRVDGWEARGGGLVEPVGIVADDLDEAEARRRAATWIQAATPTWPPPTMPPITGRSAQVVRVETTPVAEYVSEPNP
jgi:hypothetical protein